MSENYQRSPLDPPMPDQYQSGEIWGGLYGSAHALVIAKVAASQQNIIVVLTANNREAEILEESLKFYSSDSRSFPINIFPGWECLPYDDFSPHQDILSERIKILSKLPTMEQGILIVSADNLMQKLPPVSYMSTNALSLDVGQTVDVEQFRNQLDQSAYHSTEQVQFPGEYVFRGGVIDLFPMGSVDPIRIELFGNEIDTLRYFSVDSQRSIRKVNKVRILPGNEVPMNEKSIQSFRQGIREIFDADPRENTIYIQIDSNILPNGAEFYLPLFYESTSTLFDYLPSSANCFIMEGFETATEKFWEYAKERYDIVRDYISRRPLPVDMLFLSPDQVRKQIDSVCHVHIRKKSKAANVTFDGVEPNQFYQQRRTRKFENLVTTVVKASKSKTLLTFDDFGQRQTVESALSSMNVSFSRVESWREFVQFSGELATFLSRLPEGIDFPENKLRIVTSSELLGVRGQLQKPVERVRNPESVITSMEELKIGEPVVHEQYGTGIYQGLVTMNVTGHPAEFMKIEYLGNENLYVTVHNIDYVSRFVGGNSEDVTLHYLNSKSWNKAKRKARQETYDVAAELLEIQSLRDSREGNSMPLPHKDYQEFVSRFQYVETPDQNSAISAVLNDLNSSRPMDRLICGDVGFGKTEVAMRAALVAVANGYQVAVVVPTTLLAQQHFDVFLDRFSEMGVQIKLMSRMRSKSDVTAAIDGLKNGAVDIAIGTHRLLQQDVKFANLGLLILDEEHRFGVRQKETLKKMRADVDILTLTATPIPRTLSMALNSIRDISIIATPPDNRLSVRTFVNTWQPHIVREACLREVQRGGQIFYIHNDVRTIRRVADEIARIVPEANVGYAHGQMPKVQLEQVMKSFYMQKFNLLVCTTIIESGIDIPTANTIIIDKAFRFGLAQLHQLRGRVGRSHHQAYAYLLVPSKESLRSNAKHRLEAIESFDQLGMGYILATHDLEIRGAGTLLGEKQSGSINDIGYSIYSRFLNEAVTILKKSGQISIQEDVLGSTQKDVEIELQVPALIPEDWIPNVNLRLMLYRKIADVSDYQTLNQLKEEMLDRFGEFPEEITSLFHVKTLKLQSQPLGVEKLNIKTNTGRIVFGPSGTVDFLGIKNLIDNYPGTIRRIDSESALEFTHTLNLVQERIKRAYFVLDIIKPKTLSQSNLSMV